MTDWGGKFGGWLIGVAGICAGLAAVILTWQTTRPRGAAHFWFVVLFVIVIASLAALVVTGIRSAWAIVNASRERRRRKHVLRAGDRLSVGESLWSPGERVRLELQDDGNLVVKIVGYGPVYDLGTVGSRGQYVKITQAGGFALYAADGEQIRSWGEKGTRLMMQDDANLCLYPDDGKAVWAAGFVARGLGD